MTTQTPTASPRILVAPLDWGLGHATRCIPLVHALLAAGATVILAAEGAVQQLLQAEFPQLQCLTLPGYRIRYGRNAFAFKILQQLPSIRKAIRSEHAWLQKVMVTECIDAVISDNRYGFYSNHCPSVIITHQLSVRSGFGSAPDALLRHLHYRMLQKFDAVWVPDAPGNHNLAGALSHPGKLPSVPVHYIGTLSRLYKTGKMPGTMLLILLSGPEPQRSMLEAELFPQIENYPGEVVLLRGLPGNEKLPDVRMGVTVFNHLPAAELAEYMERASAIICRSGYSTLMDLARMEKRCVLVPTPGQTEQEYLATRCVQMGWALSVQQGAIHLQRAVEELARSHAQMPALPASIALQDAVQEFLHTIASQQKMIPVS